MEAKDFIVKKVSKSHGTTKAHTSESDDNVVFNLMRQICSETQRMDLSKVYCMIFEMRIQFPSLGFELYQDRNDAGQPLLSCGCLK